MEYIHHYTNINTLALILKHKTIRFNRLDHVDDVSESKAFDKFDLSNNIFVSCWTDSSKENIPQWHIYTEGMRGVRITLPKNFIQYNSLGNSNGEYIKIQDGAESPIPLDQLFTDKYIISPNIIERNSFEKKVEYIDDLKDIYKDSISMKSDKNGDDMLVVFTEKLAKFKQKHWAFQEEFRFILFIYPPFPIPPEGIYSKEYMTQMPRYLLQAMKDSKAPPIDWFDLNVPDALDNMKVTLGPLCNEGDKILVESLLSSYTAHGVIKESLLKGDIRSPKRY